VPLIPVFNMSRHLQENNAVILNAVKRVLDSSVLILGNEVASFEIEFSKYLGAGNCIGVANGTDALELALRGLGADSKSRVGLVGNAGGYSRIAIDQVGCTPVYLPIEDDGFCMSLDATLNSVSRGDLDFIIVTHLYGQIHPDISELARICKSAQVPLIEDCAQAHGAHVDGIKAGTFGDVATFSFYPTKNLGAIGDGGAVVCEDLALAARIRSLSQYGWEEKYMVQISGGRNSRLDEVQAAILRDFLPKVNSWNAKRLHVAEMYLSTITNPHISLLPFNLGSYVGHLFPLLTAQPYALINHLKSKGVMASIHYPVDDEQQYGWKNSSELTSLSNKLFPVTLPISQYLEVSEINQIIDSVNSYSEQSLT
jgi:dTDP-4-amino-4,6-dideoxygalactose transaminase